MSREEDLGAEIAVQDAENDRPDGVAEVEGAVNLAAVLGEPAFGLPEFSFLTNWRPACKCLETSML